MIGGVKLKIKKVINKILDAALTMFTTLLGVILIWSLVRESGWWAFLTIPGYIIGGFVFTMAVSLGMGLAYHLIEKHTLDGFLGISLPASKKKKNQ